MVVWLKFSAKAVHLAGTVRAPCFDCQQAHRRGTALATGSAQPLWAPYAGGISATRTFYAVPLIARLMHEQPARPNIDASSQRRIGFNVIQECVGRLLVRPNELVHVQHHAHLAHTRPSDRGCEFRCLGIPPCKQDLAGAAGARKSRLSRLPPCSPASRPSGLHTLHGSSLLPHLHDEPAVPRRRHAGLLHHPVERLQRQLHPRMAPPGRLGDVLLLCPLSTSRTSRSGPRPWASCRASCCS